MISSVRIKNLRSLADTGFIKLKPITLLLGANSTGKSTFLRSFLLFTQSMSKYLRGPILWYDESMVDFGDYDTAKNRYAADGETIEFAYKIDAPLFGWPKNPLRKFYDTILIDGLNDSTFSFSLKNDNSGTYINSIKIDMRNFCLKIEAPERTGQLQFEVNGHRVEIDEPVTWDSSSYDNILPKFDYNYRAYRNIKEDPFLSRYPIILSKVIEFVKERSDKRLKKDEFAIEVYQSWEPDKDNYLKWLKNKSSIASFKNYVRDWTEESGEFLTLYYMIALARLLPVLETVDEELGAFYSGCSYIAPTRAGANRYYRQQELQVSDLDPYGKNLSEFITALPDEMRRSFHDYTMKVLGVEVDIKTQPGLQSIMLKNEKGEFNISDVGFGYSQILPIVTKLWYVSNLGKMGRTGLARSRNAVDNIVLMEQPELHLHPAYQAKIADAFVNMMNSEWNLNNLYCKVKLIAETHSDTILNRIGRRVREGYISPDDVNIVLFEKGMGEHSTLVRQTTYNENGQIKEWPYGFFDPDEDY